MVWPFRRKRMAERRNPLTTVTDRRVLSFVSPQEAQVLGGIPIQAVVGEFEGEAEDFSVGSFRPNPLFSAFLHKTIQTWGPEDPELRAAARGQASGWIYAHRSSDANRALRAASRLRTLLVRFKSKVARSLAHRATSLYRLDLVYTHNGMCRLPASLRIAMIRRLQKVASGGAA